MLWLPFSMQTIVDVEQCVDDVIEVVGKRIRLAAPLGLGKPIPLLNAFYRRALHDPSIVNLDNPIIAGSYIGKPGEADPSYGVFRLIRRGER